MYTGNLLRGTLANSKDPDEMQHNAAFHQGLHCLLRLKQTSGTEIHHNLENDTCEPLKCTMGSPIVVLSLCMGKSIRIQRVKHVKRCCTFGDLSFIEKLKIMLQTLTVFTWKYGNFTMLVNKN